MEHPEQISPVNANQIRVAPPMRETVYRAVQGDTAVTCVDWQAFHSWQDGDPAFTGVITVLDNHGGQQTMANWSSPTDSAADTSLANTGWRRVGPWNPDNNGRRSAPVHRSPHRRRSTAEVDTASTQQQGTYTQHPDPGPPDDEWLTADAHHTPVWSASDHGTEIDDVRCCRGRRSTLGHPPTR